MERAKGISTIKVLIVIITLMVGSNGVDFSLSSAQAAEGYTTAVHADLISLPPPQDQTVVAVYQLKDQSEQDESKAMFSAAVARGASSMLNKALVDSGWFIPIERQGLPSLLNERDIINARGQQEQEQAEEKLPPLLYAGKLLEGGIIVSQTDVVSAELLSKYFNANAPGQVKRNRVTVYLRLVSVRSGRIIKSVSSTRSILSEEVDFGVYKFVRMKKLLEAETGLSTFEPTTICAREAIQRAVFDLVVEGIQGGVWSLKNPEDIDSPVIQKYFEEKKQAGKMTAFNDKGDSEQAKEIEQTEPEVGEFEVVAEPVPEQIAEKADSEVAKEAGSEIVVVTESEGDVSEVTSIDIAAVSEANDIVLASEFGTEESTEQPDAEEVETAEAIEPEGNKNPKPGIIIVESEAETVVANLEVNVEGGDSNDVAMAQDVENDEAEIQIEVAETAEIQVTAESGSVEAVVSEANDVAASETDVKQEPEAIVVETTPEPVAANLQGDVGISDSNDVAVSVDAENTEAEETVVESVPVDANSACSEPNNVTASVESEEAAEQSDAKAEETAASEQAVKSEEVSGETESTEIAEAETKDKDVEASSEEAAVAETNETEATEPNNVAEAEVTDDAEQAESQENTEATEPDNIVESKSEVEQETESVESESKKVLAENKDKTLYSFVNEVISGGDPEENVTESEIAEQLKPEEAVVKTEPDEAVVETKPEAEAALDSEAGENVAAESEPAEIEVQKAEAVEVDQAETETETVVASEEAEETGDSQVVEVAESADTSDADAVSEPEIGDVEKLKPEIMVVKKEPESVAANLEEGLGEVEEAANPDPLEIAATEPETEETAEQNDAETEEVAVEEKEESESANVTESDPNNVAQSTEEVTVEESDPNSVKQQSEEVADSATEDSEKKSDPNDVTVSESESEQQTETGSAEESESESQEQTSSDEKSESSSEAETESSDDSTAGHDQS